MGEAVAKAAPKEIRQQQQQSLKEMSAELQAAPAWLSAPEAATALREDAIKERHKRAFDMADAMTSIRLSAKAH